MPPLVVVVKKLLFNRVNCVATMLPPQLTNVDCRVRLLRLAPAALLMVNAPALALRVATGGSPILNGLAIVAPPVTVRPWGAAVVPMVNAPVSVPAVSGR